MVDQNSQFYAILTNVGAAKQANADALGTAWKITQMGVGDANGTDPTPNATQKALINEWRRAPLNQLKVDDKDAAIIVAEQVIPAEVGGKWIREIGLYDADGDLVAVANCAPTYKPLLSQGSGRTQVVRMSLVVSSSSNVQLKIDPSLVLATREWVTEELARQDFKHSVVAATTANIALTGLQTVDGVALQAGNRVLVKNQTAAKDNGIYVVATAAWTRATDADTSSKVTPGLLVLVEKGTVNGDSAWQLVTDAPTSLGVTGLAFEMAFGRTGVAAGTYRSVTVDKYGRVTAATNPTTVAGYGLTDVYTKTEVDSALAAKAPLASPSLTGTPTAPTPAAGNNSLQVANTAFVQAAVAALVASAPGALDTLKELAAALGDDPNFATTMTNALAAKAPLASPTFTGVPKAPTAASTANDTSLATTQFVQSLLGAFGWGSGGVQGSNIPNGTNLNSIVTPGSYGQSSSFQATTELNYPEPSAGTLLVQAAGLSIVTQQYTLHTANNKVFVRTCYAGTWSKWDETAKVVSPVFSGVPQAPTAPVGTNTGQIATMAAILAGMLQYGIGGTSPAVSDLDAVSASGLYRCTSTAVNAPNTGCLLHIQYGSAGQASVQIHLNTTSSVPVLQIRSKTTTMAYGAWVPLASLADITAAFAAVGVGGVGAIAPAYTVTPAQCNNVSATRVIQALSTDDQATVGSPVAGQAFGGWHIIRAIRPAQLGVAGAGAGASLWWRGFTGPAPSQDDWIQGAPLNSPAFTGAPTAPTQAAGNNTTRLATTAFVQAAISALVASAPGALDTLNELATALGNDPNFATTMTNSLAAKAPLASPGLTGVPTAPTAAVGTSNSQVATTAFVRAAMAKYGLGTADLLDLVGVDLNTVFEGGQYFAGNGTNFPPGITNGYLTVWGNAFTHGAQKMIGAGNGVEWTRTAVAGVWTEWTMDGAPPGTIVYFPGFLPPPGYLKANGAQVSRTTYAKLFSAIGTVGGAGDGSTTFNVPDLRGEFIRSWDDARGVDQNRALMSVQISQNLSHAHGGVTDANGAHSHAVSGYTTSSGAHAHPVNRALNSSVGSLSDRVTTAQGDSGVAAAVTGGGDHSHSFSGNSDTVGLHAHNLSIWADGGNEARPRNIAMLACIKY